MNWKRRARNSLLKGRFKDLVRHRSIACRDIVETAQQLGNSAFDQSDVQKCKEFLKKYGVRKGSRIYFDCRMRKLMRR